MTIFLLDENVLREMTAGGNAKVRKWAATVSDGDLRISVMTFFEKPSGWLARLRKNPDDTDARAKLAALERLEACYRGRILAVDIDVMREWSRLLGAKQKGKIDAALAATARIHGLVVATRNVRDFVGRGVDVVDPFHDPPRLHPASWHG